MKTRIWIPVFALAGIAMALNLGITQPTDAATETQPAPQPKIATGFINKEVAVGSEKYRYSVFVPHDYTPEKRWPIVLFLHGSGERGSDGLKQTEIGIGRALRLHQQWFPCIVVMPQCRANDVWWSPKMTEMVFATMNATGREYALDATRIYVTGLSLGGGGTWYFAAQMENQVAAAIPVCALSEDQMGLADKLVPHLTNIPMWCFHGTKDDRVPVASSRSMVQKIKEAGGHIKLTELPNGNHFIWNKVYDDAKLWQWMFDQRLERKKTTKTTQD